MEDVSNISSEEDLLQLRNEGKINDDEYQDLLAAMKKPEPRSAEAPESPAPEAKSKQRLCRTLGIIAFILMILGIVLPAVVWWSAESRARHWSAQHPESPEMHAGIGAVHVVFFVACELAAFVMGILAWPDRFAKATVITISIMAVVLLLIFWEVRVEA